MKQITVTETVFTLDELSDSARQTALEKMSTWMNEWIEPDDRRTAVMLCLIRHASGDWGCVDDVHRDANIQSTVEGKGPILSEFEVDGRSLYIGTNDNIDGQLSTVVFFKEESGTECIGVQWA